MWKIFFILTLFHVIVILLGCHIECFWTIIDLTHSKRFFITIISWFHAVFHSLVVRKTFLCNVDWSPIISSSFNWSSNIGRGIWRWTSFSVCAGFFTVFCSQSHHGTDIFVHIDMVLLSRWVSTFLKRCSMFYKIWEAQVEI